MTLPWLYAAASLALAWFGTRVVLGGSGIATLDVPNARSAHATPVPRGGGLAIVVAAALAAAALAGVGAVDRQPFIAAWAGALAIALVGFVDDRRPLPARVRFIVHLTAACLAVWAIGVPPLPLASREVALGGVGAALAVVALVWSTNLYNFMDGNDGLAGSEAVFVCAAGAWLSAAAGAPEGLVALWAALAGASGGFLAWNWPPARIFMGDVGSGFLGFTIAALALLTAASGGPSIWVWAILGACFVTDATVTLVRRAARGEPLAQAHRSHAYQWLATRWGGHRPVTLLATVVNLAWCLPWAWLATARPSLGVVCAGVAYAALLVATLLAGAGRAR